MAGSHNKKSSERRDSFRQPQQQQQPQQPQQQQLPQQQQQQAQQAPQQRRNPGGRKDDKGNMANARAPIPPSAHHTPRNNFNSSEVVQFLNERFSSALAASQDVKLDSATRPEKYESQEKAWGNRGSLSSVLSPKGGIMSSGADFFTEVVNRAK